MKKDHRTIRLPCNYNLYQFEQLKSTNELVKNSPKTFIKSGNYAVILANSQYGGYGRGSNTWASPEGNLYMTIAFEKKQQRYALFQYPFLIAVIIGEVLAKYSCFNNKSNINSLNSLNSVNSVNRDDINNINRDNNSNNSNSDEASNVDFYYYNYQYKWPNDILINEKKIAGILIEYEYNNIIIGIGLNLKVAPLKYSTCLQDCLKDGAKKAHNNYMVLPTLQEIVEEIIDKFDNAQKTPLTFFEIKKLWEKKSYLLNSEINFNHNGSIISGKFIGIDKDGSLKLERINGEIQNLYSGSICFPYTEEV